MKTGKGTIRERRAEAAMARVEQQLQHLTEAQSAITRAKEEAIREIHFTRMDAVSRVQEQERESLGRLGEATSKGVVLLVESVSTLMHDAERRVEEIRKLTMNLLKSDFLEKRVAALGAAAIGAIQRAVSHALEDAEAGVAVHLSPRDLMAVALTEIKNEDGSVKEGVVV